MLGEDVLQEMAREPRRVIIGVSGDEQRHLREVVNNDEDGVKALRYRQPFDEVHRDGAPWPLWYGQEAKGAIGFVPNSFVAAAAGASTYVAVDVRRHVGPVVASAQDLYRLGDARVSHKVVVMAGL